MTISQPRTSTRMKQDLEKQEALVQQLWDFAGKLQHSPNQGCVVTRESDGTKASLAHVESALTNILEIFGYETIPID